MLCHALKWKRRWGINLISLQLNQREPIVTELVAQGKLQQLKEGGDWEDTAKIVEQLDLVVSVDTAIVHLAGNLGIPCLLLLNYAHDWRWGTDNEPVKWYPKQTVLRCKRNDDWEKLLEEADLWVSALLDK